MKEEKLHQKGCSVGAKGGEFVELAIQETLVVEQASDEKDLENQDKYHHGEIYHGPKVYLFVISLCEVTIPRFNRANRGLKMSDGLYSFVNTLKSILEIVDFAIVFHDVLKVFIDEFLEIIFVFIIIQVVVVVHAISVEGEKYDSFVIGGDAIVETQLIFSLLHDGKSMRVFCFTKVGKDECPRRGMQRGVDEQIPTIQDLVFHGDLIVLSFSFL